MLDDDGMPSAYERAVAKIEVATASTEGSTASYEAELLERNAEAERELAEMQAALAAGTPLPSEVAPVVSTPVVKIAGPAHTLPLRISANSVAVAPVENHTRMEFLELDADADPTPDSSK